MAARSHSPKRMLVGFDARESDATPVLGMADMPLIQFAGPAGTLRIRGRIGHLGPQRVDTVAHHGVRGPFPSLLARGMAVARTHKKSEAQTGEAPKASIRAMILASRQFLRDPESGGELQLYAPVPHYSLPLGMPITRGLLNNRREIER